MWAGPGHEKSGLTLALPMDSVVLATQCTMYNHSMCSEMGVVDKSVNERKRIITCSCDKLYLTLLCQTCQTCNLLFFCWHSTVTSTTPISNHVQWLPHCTLFSEILTFNVLWLSIVCCVASTPQNVLTSSNISPLFSNFFYSFNERFKRFCLFTRQHYLLLPKLHLLGFYSSLNWYHNTSINAKKKLDSTVSNNPSGGHSHMVFWLLSH